MWLEQIADKEFSPLLDCLCCVFFPPHFPPPSSALVFCLPLLHSHPSSSVVLFYSVARQPFNCQPETLSQVSTSPSTVCLWESRSVLCAFNLLTVLCVGYADGLSVMADMRSLSTNLPTPLPSSALSHPIRSSYATMSPTSTLSQVSTSLWY